MLQGWRNLSPKLAKKTSLPNGLPSSLSFFLSATGCHRSTASEAGVLSQTSKGTSSSTPSNFYFPSSVSFVFISSCMQNEYRMILI
jgi:hypothetical protein